MKKFVALFLTLVLAPAGISMAQTQAPPNNPQCSDFTFDPVPVPALTQSSNPQYFSYNGTTLPLVGLSSEFLCHVAQPGTFTVNSVVVTPDNSYCTWANYRSFIDRLATSGLNVFQVWLSLNQSVGKARGLGAPYANEQPFTYSAGKWDLASYDSTFFQRLQCVIAYAATKNVMVEVTLFDPWSTSQAGNDWTQGPWADAFNTQASTGFTQRQYFASFEGPGKSDTATANANARFYQDQFVTKVVSDLNPYPNIYWEIANETDLGGIVTGTAAMQWQDHVAQVIQAAEAGKKVHRIGVNVFTNSGATALIDAVANPFVSQSQVVSSHYVTADQNPPGDTSYGAIELLRARIGTASFTNRLFGFNEGRSTPNPTIPASARSEAWEFMTSEAGLYDNYNLSYKTNSTTIDPLTDKIIKQLGVLKTTLSGMDLANVSRDGFCGPTSNCWIRGLHTYGSADAAMSCGGTTWQGSTYWAAMHSPSSYLFYQHHSRLSSLDPPFSLNTRYVPPPAGCPAAGSEYRESTLSFRPVQAGSYLVQWIEPGTGVVKFSTTMNGLLAGVDYALPASHLYIYDVALRIQKQ